MNITLRPDHEKFITEQVQAGHFKSVEEAVAAAVSKLIEEDLIDPQDLLAVEEGLGQAERGEGFTVAEVKDQFGQRGVNLR